MDVYTLQHASNGKEPLDIGDREVVGVMLNGLSPGSGQSLGEGLLVRLLVLANLHDVLVEGVLAAGSHEVVTRVVLHTLFVEGGLEVLEG